MTNHQPDKFTRARQILIGKKRSELGPAADNGHSRSFLGLGAFIAALGALVLILGEPLGILAVIVGVLIAGFAAVTRSNNQRGTGAP